MDMMSSKITEDNRNINYILLKRKILMQRAKMINPLTNYQYFQLKHILVLI